MTGEYLLCNTSADDLKVTIQCANMNGRPFSLDLLLRSLDQERKGAGPRKTIINLLEREIKRQNKITEIR
jgi:hypothetical protein